MSTASASVILLVVQTEQYMYVSDGETTFM